MTKTRTALAAGLLTVTAFAAGHQVAHLDTGAPAPTVSRTSGKTAPPGKTATGDAPALAKPAPKGIDLGDPSGCRVGGTCLSEKYYLLPLRG
jgi:hypothetical protein